MACHPVACLARVRVGYRQLARHCRYPVSSRLVVRGLGTPQGGWLRGCLRGGLGFELGRHLRVGGGGVDDRRCCRPGFRQRIRTWCRVRLWRRDGLLRELPFEGVVASLRARGRRVRGLPFLRPFVRSRAVPLGDPGHPDAAKPLVVTAGRHRHDDVRQRRLRRDRQRGRRRDPNQDEGGRGRCSSWPKDHVRTSLRDLGDGGGWWSPPSPCDRVDGCQPVTRMSIASTFSTGIFCQLRSKVATPLPSVVLPSNLVAAESAR